MGPRCLVGWVRRLLLLLLRLRVVHRRSAFPRVQVVPPLTILAQLLIRQMRHLKAFSAPWPTVRTTTCPPQQHQRSPLRLLLQVARRQQLKPQLRRLRVNPHRRHRLDCLAAPATRPRRSRRLGAVAQASLVVHSKAQLPLLVGFSQI